MRVYGIVRAKRGVPKAFFADLSARVAGVCAYVRRAGDVDQKISAGNRWRTTFNTQHGRAAVDGCARIVLYTIIRVLYTVDKYNGTTTVAAVHVMILYIYITRAIKGNGMKTEWDGEKTREEKKKSKPKKKNLLTP